MILADGLNMENLLNPNIIKAMPAELISSLLVMAIISIFSIIVYIKQRKTCSAHRKLSEKDGCLQNCNKRRRLGNSQKPS